MGEMKPRVLIADKLSPAALAIFAERGVEADVRTGLTKDEFAAIIGGYDGLAVRSATKVTADIVSRAKKLKVVGRAGIGIDTIDVAAATAAGIIVMNTPFGNSITTAEHAIALMMALARDIPAANASTQAGKWEKNRFLGVELYGKTLGLVGCGNVGGIVADRAKGLKMRVIAYDPYLSPERAGQLGVEKVSLDDLLARADFVSLHTPLTNETRNIISAASIAQMKKGARLSIAHAAGWWTKRRLRPPSIPASSPALRSTCSARNRQRRTSCSATNTSWRRRIWAPRPSRRRRTWRFRWPSRFPITCLPAPSPMR